MCYRNICRLAHLHNSVVWVDVLELISKSTEKKKLLIIITQYYKLEFLIDSLSFCQLALQIIVVGALRSACIFAPFVAFQAYGYYNMCVGRFPDEIRPWCKARVPLLYNYIQSHYWYVHF